MTLKMITICDRCGRESSDIFMDTIQHFRSTKPVTTSLEPPKPEEIFHFCGFCLAEFKKWVKSK